MTNPLRDDASETPVKQRHPAPARAGKLREWNDRRIMIVLACFFAFLYGYFFQGGGANSNSNFDAIRALSEHGTAEITLYADNTGDKGEYHGSIYSNKLPGLAFIGVPFYFVAYHVERLLGFNPGSFATAALNQRLLTFLLSGIPGVALLLILFRHFRQRNASLYEAFFLTSAFGTGSLLVPYSGLLMDHLMVALLLFGIWHILSGPGIAARASTGAGLLTGLALLTDSLATPATALFVLYLWARKPTVLVRFLAAAVPLALVLPAYNYLCFDSIFTGNHSIMAEVFKQPGDLFGVFYWPQPVRLFWLTFQPYRGLFYCCPIFLISLFSLPWPVRRRELTWENIIPLLVVGYHLLFNLTFNGWTGGWAVGPRYLIPALPFLFSFALTGYRRFRAQFSLLAAVSAVFMISIAAVLVTIPGEDYGPPPAAANPVFDSIGQLISGKISVSIFPVPSRNFGELSGLPGIWSLAPALLALTVFFLFGWHLRQQSEGSDLRARRGI